MKYVLIVDDSQVDQTMTERAVNQCDPDAVCLCASDAFEARELIAKYRPEVVFLDLNMPRMSGECFLRHLMKACPIPVFIVTGTVPSKDDDRERLKNSGAIELIPKPSSLADSHRFANSIRDALAVADGFDSNHAEQRQGPGVKRPVCVPPIPVGDEPNAILALGSSTGGPAALQTILEGLQTGLPPIVIAQHLSPKFVGPLIESLNLIGTLPVYLAEASTPMRSGNVYVAPAAGHTRVRPDFTFEQVPAGAGDRFRPSVDVLFESLAEISSIPVVAAILTGMGNDGAKGILALREAGARTVAQDEETCVVYGMPKRAVEMNAVEEVLPLHEIAGWLTSHARAVTAKRLVAAR
ncbi:MAG: chemotaxis protein CheB [Planctomycetota bacterium]